MKATIFTMVLQNKRVKIFVITGIINGGLLDTIFFHNNTKTLPTIAGML